jgi:hypothetical protein
MTNELTARHSGESRNPGKEIFFVIPLFIEKIRYNHLTLEFWALKLEIGYSIHSPS